MHNGRIRAAGALALLALAATTGCSSSSAGSAKADPAAAQRAQSALNEVQSVKEQVGLLERQLIKKCMLDQGFTVFPPLPEAQPEKDEHKKPAGVTPDLAEAQKTGYGISTSLAASAIDSVPTQQGAWQSLPDAEKQRFTTAQIGTEDQKTTYDFGDGQVSAPTAGCFGTVRAALYGDQKAYLRLDWIATNQAGVAKSKAAQSDPEVIKAKNSWIACMAQSEYPGLGTPVDARKSAEAYYDGLSPQSAPDALRSALDKEIKIATADAQCGTKAGLNEAVATAQSAANAQYLTQHEADLVQYRTIMLGAVKQGQKMLGS
ncbi:hypothetical protein [Streptomyces sp. NPDC059874]|uniref:hypothetical protein n=1 Tax=Streptomyces sp. NPDC059874 TaxID=3346983 RepID=UPI003656A4FD